MTVFLCWKEPTQRNRGMLCVLKNFSQPVGSARRAMFFREKGEDNIAGTIHGL